MEVRLLGKVGVYLHDGERPLPSSGPRCVLAALALNAGKPVPADRLVNCIWLPSKQTDRSLETLARYAGHVDKAIREAGGDPKSLEYDSRDRTYTLNIAPSEVDYHQFGELYAEARQRQIPELFDRAAALWKGEPLADVEGSWAGNRRLDLQNEFRRFQHERFQALIKAGQADRVFREIVQLVEYNPEDAFLTDGALALAELDRRAEIVPWIERFTRLCDQIKEAPPHPEAVAEAERISSPDAVAQSHVIAVEDVLTIDDVHVEKGSGRVVLDVRLRNCGTYAINVTAAAVRILERKPYLSTYPVTADYDLLIDGEYNEVDVAHLIKPDDVVDRFTLTLGFAPAQNGVLFDAEVLVRYNGGHTAVSKPIRFDSCFE